MKQIAVRIGGFVVNAGSQTIVLDRNTQLLHQFAFRHADAVNLVLLRAGITI